MLGFDLGCKADGKGHKESRVYTTLFLPIAAPSITRPLCNLPSLVKPARMPIVSPLMTTPGPTHVTPPVWSLPAHSSRLTDCDCGGTPASPLTDGASTHCKYTTLPKSPCPPPFTTEAPPAPTGTISCFTSVAIATASVNDLINHFCHGDGGHAIGGPKMNEAQPWGAMHDISGEYLKKQDAVGARLYVDRKGCKNAEFDIAKSTAACSSYMAQITQSCIKDECVD